MPSATVEGRDVYHRLGTRTQSVSICTSDNREGVYEDRYSLPIAVELSATDLAAQPDLRALRDWLASHGGQPLSTDGRPGDRLPPLCAASVADEQWVADAKAAVERVLDAVVDDFCEQPYLHRVEHSLHAWLWSRLQQERVLQDVVNLKDGRNRTQLVHKEWPETHPRKRADGTEGPRGLFDLAILSPQQVGEASLEQLVFGRIEAPIVIEVGLDYGFPHLRQDAHKMLNSGVPAAYILHLSRLTDKDRTDTEQLLCNISDGRRSAYAHIHPQTGAVRSKHVRDLTVSERAPQSKDDCARLA